MNTGNYLRHHLCENKHRTEGHYIGSILVHIQDEGQTISSLLILTEMSSWTALESTQWTGWREDGEETRKRLQLNMVCE